MINILILIIGFVMLIKGADLFVDGSSGLAKNFKVPGVIIGLTIVALGTSAPELAVSTSAALSGSNEIALSNVVGSNIFNILSVLGVCAIIHPIPVDSGIIKRDFPLSIISTVIVMLVTGGITLLTGNYNILTDTSAANAYNTTENVTVSRVESPSMSDNVGAVTRITGALLIATFIVYIIILVAEARKNPEKEEATELSPMWKCVLFILIGLALIVAGGQAVVYSAKEIARAFGMTETLIGLTIVAVGTSLPELVTSIVAARKGETGLAVGNAVGSNIFNLLLILGVSAVIHPVAVNLASVYDMCILIVISIITYIFSITKKTINRLEGAVMVLLYVADVVFAIVR
ncbi:MAG: calcium/sodium antiporter [Lachnospiraceae bacterium]|nr:calcium/sodium antiporter [Lachnospiraceae bacterium]